MDIKTVYINLIICVNRPMLMQGILFHRSDGIGEIASSGSF